MLSHHFRMAWRNMARRKTFTLIHVTGLALGICCCLVIFLLMRFEFSFDSFHPNKGQVYRLLRNRHFVDGRNMLEKGVPAPVASAVREEIPGVEAVAGFYPYWASIVIPADGKNNGFESTVPGTQVTGTILADSNYFSLLPYEWIAGNPSTSLRYPLQVVLTESRAQIYFPGLPVDRVLGKEIVYNDSLRVRVSGVVKDWQGNTDFPFSDFISLVTVNTSFLKQKFSLTDWEGHRSLLTFVKLSPSLTAAGVNTQLAGLVSRHVPADPAAKTSLRLQSLADIHFNPDVDDDFRKASKPLLFILSTIALFILVVAIVNFINLSTAESIQRVKEVGIRKVLGSSRKNLVSQFLTETCLHGCLAAIAAVLMAGPVIAFFHDYIPAGVKLHWGDPATGLFLVLVTIVTSLLAGLYPARVIASYLPASSLKGTGQGSERWWLRRGLIVFQFALSLVFIIGTLVIGNQLRFIRNKDLGLTADAVINLRIPPADSLHKGQIFSRRIRQLTGVAGVAAEVLPPVGDPSFFLFLTYEGDKRQPLRVLARGGDENLVPLYKMHLVAGRNLSGGDSTRELLINESLSKSLGFAQPAEALGKLFHVDTGKYNLPILRGRYLSIAGVVADINEYSLHQAVQPMVIAHIPAVEGGLAVKLDLRGGQLTDVKSVLAPMEQLWKQLYPGVAFNYSFLDESIARMYESDRRTATIVNVAMVLTIFISCMGLFGLALFTAEKRTREIGIRKVLGASVSGIVLLLSGEFLVLVGLAFAVSTPVAWFFMNKWLQNFAYRAPLAWWIFLIAGASAVGIALLTISFQAIRAAMANPINSLRTD
jgi:putative ABC transport system permease protein